MYDDLSRSIAVVENRTGTFGESNITWSSNNWSVSWGTSPPVDENRVTTFVYDNNSNVIKRTAHLNSGDVQVTEYEYGVSATTGSDTMESRIDAPGMLAEIHYPNESTGLADSSGAYTVSFAYNRLGEMRGKTDQNGIEHAYTLDGSGRVTSDKVDFPSGTDIDDAVAEITTDYDDHGRISGVYSWDGSTTPVELNSVEYEYTKLHQIEAVVQNVDVDGGASDERVEYDYDSAEPASTGGNYTRLSAVRYPAQSSGSTSSYELDYGVTGSVNDTISRVDGINVPNWSPPNDELVSYKYVGLNLPVKVRYLSGSILLDSTKAPDGSAPTGEYPAFDRFGRVVWHAWVNNGFTTGPNTGFPNASPLMARQYAYDDTTKLRNLDWDGRPGAVLGDRDWEYDYDELDRLVEASRGQWDNSGSSLTLAANSRQWDLDMLGNWNSVATDLNGTSGFEAGDETELRTFNLANELLTREGEPGSGSGGSTPVHNPEYDDAGNLTNNGAASATELEYVYDAWNRLVRVERPGSFSVLENEYNAMGWRIIRRLDTSDSAYDGLDEQRHYYFTPSWQMIEEHVDTNNDGDFADSGDFKSQQFWGIRYIDDAVAKRIDRDNDGDWEEAGDQYFYLTDSMYSIRALTDSAGYVRERVDYTPYGKAMHRYAGDYNGDGMLNFGDISIFNGQSGKSPGDSGYNPHVDLNGDGTLGSLDLSILMADLNFVGTGGNGVPPEGWLSDNARTSSDGTDNQFGFDGYWFDAAGATDAGSAGVYCVVRNRVYGVGLGRWLQRDPVGYVDGMNVYQYVSSSPASHNDPSGLKRIIVAFDGQNFGIGGFSAGGPGSMRTRDAWNSKIKETFPNDILWHSEEDGDWLQRQAGKIRSVIANECRKTCKKPTVILLGHSNGADGARKTADHLNQGSSPVAVSLLFTVDAVYKPWWNHDPDRGWPITGNVTRAINWYQRMDPAIMGVRPVRVKFQGYEIAYGIGQVNNHKLRDKPRSAAGWWDDDFFAHSAILDEISVQRSAYEAIQNTPAYMGKCDD